VHCEKTLKKAMSDRICLFKITLLFAYNPLKGHRPTVYTIELYNSLALPRPPLPFLHRIQKSHLAVLKRLINNNVAVYITGIAVDITMVELQVNAAVNVWFTMAGWFCKQP